ncbi:restriction endonuclease subunit S [Roseovarius nubinhibens]|uniref:restriction endonuclease subunit S n=1 Tax=Roseovarius nubinhibens TaxID=314263 RepID=UPI001C09A61C|nr:restriction endonuclease subunit S [Roseovarius nubinhibens]MBU3000316.1 restriction endonuclease subunit S [Roseovarius nubinhibens]
MNFTGNFQKSVFKRHFQITLGKMLQTQQKTDECVQLPYMRAANVGDGSLNLDDLNDMWFTPRDVRQYTLSEGDLLVLEGGDVGRSAIMQKVEGTIGFQNSVHRVRPRKHNLNPFGQYWLNHLKSSGYFDLVCSKATLSHFTVEKFLETPFPNIGFEQQKAIADYLDRETGRIDGLIEKKTRFIALLKEKRAAVIDHAVTKGVDRNAEMKPSGVEWIGDIPAHWDAPRIATLFREAFREPDPDLPVLSVSIHNGVSDGELSDEERDRKVALSEDRTKYQGVEPGDLVYNMMRAWQGAFGAVAVSGLVSPAYVVARPIAEFRTKFLEHLLHTKSAAEEIRRYSRGIADFRMRLYWDYFRDIRVCLPPLPEQDEILSHIDRETARIQGLIEKTERSIALLKEKRAALITAAVTGKIDVRAAA